VKLLVSLRLAVLALLCSISTLAAADTVVYPEKHQSSLRWFGGSLVPASYPQMNSHHGDGTVLVSRFATYWLESSSGQGRIRITVPLQFYLASWDVGALERELERLGVKLKPKPRKKPLPKPGTVISG